MAIDIAILFMMETIQVTNRIDKTVWRALIAMYLQQVAMLIAEQAPSEWADRRQQLFGGAL
jgi:hypothetical protein